MPPKMISEGEFVIVFIHQVSSIMLVGSKAIDFGRFGKFSGLELVGKRYETMYTLNEGCVVEAEDFGLDFLNETSTNNAEIMDVSTTQSLSAGDIDLLKKSSTGENVIERIVSNNSQFEKKTVFSKQKYLKRKSKKFLCRFTLHPVDSVSLCRHFWTKQFSVRYDLLSLVLSTANVCANGRYLLIDDTNGIVVNAFLERMGGFGELCVIHYTKSLSCLKYMQFSESLLQPLKQLTKDDIEGEFDSVVLISQRDPLSLFEEFGNYLKYSGQLVVFSVCPDFLHNLYFSLRPSNEFILVSLLTTWFREYQVLDGRTHPQMSSTERSGALLTACKVMP